MSGAPVGTKRTWNLRILPTVCAALLAACIAVNIARAAGVGGGNSADDDGGERAISTYSQLVRDGGPVTIVFVVIFGGFLGGVLIVYKLVARPEFDRQDARAALAAKSTAETVEKAQALHLESQKACTEAMMGCADAQRTAAKYSALAAKASAEAVRQMRGLIHSDRNEETRAGRSGV